MKVRFESATGTPPPQIDLDAPPRVGDIIEHGHDVFAVGEVRWKIVDRARCDVVVMLTKAQ